MKEHATQKFLRGFKHCAAMIHKKGFLLDYVDMGPENPVIVDEKMFSNFLCGSKDHIAKRKKFPKNMIF